MTDYVNIASDVRTASTTPAFQQAIAEHPDQASIFAPSSSGSDTQNGAAGALEDTSFISRLDDRLAAPFRSGFSDSMDLIFLLAAGVLTIGLVSTALLPEVPLRTQSGIQALAEEAGAQKAAGGDGTGVHARPGGNGIADGSEGPGGNGAGPQPDHDPSGIPSALALGPATSGALARQLGEDPPRGKFSG